MGEKYFNYRCDDGGVAKLKLGSIRQELSARRRRGITLIEAAMVLAILAIIVAGVMLLFTNADGSRKVSDSLRDLGTVQQAVRSLYAGQSSYTGLTNTVLINTDSLHNSMVSGTTIRHTYNGTVTVAAANAGGGTGSGFSVEYTNGPSDACAKMVSNDLGRGLYSVSVGGVTRSEAGTPPPFDPGTAGTACGATSSNTITWIFR